MNVIERINNIEDFTKKQTEIANFLVNNPGQVCYMSLSKLCEEANCSEVTMLNFCKKIGYKSFIDLKKDFRKYMESRITNPVHISTKSPQLDTSVDKFLQEIIQSEINHLNHLFESLDIDQLEKISESAINSRYVVIIGHDTSYKIGSLLQYRLNKLNLSAVLIDPSDLINTEFMIGQISDEDLVIYLSFPEYYCGTEDLWKILIKQNKNILLVTNSKDNPVAKYTDQIVICKTDTKIFDNAWIVPLAFIDILTNIIALTLNFQEEK